MSRLVCAFITALATLILSQADNEPRQTGIRTWYIDEELVLDEEKEDYTQINIFMAKYLKTFTNIQRDSKDKNVKEVMDTIKLLIVHSWIKMLNPARELVEYFLPINEMQNLEVVNLNVVRALRASNAAYPVADAIITFSDSIAPQIKDLIEKEAKTLEEELDRQLLKINGEVDDKKKKELEDKYQTVEEELEDTESDLEIHGIAREMYLQSYVNVFLLRTTEKNLIIRSSNGQDERIFPVPAFDIESFGVSLVN